MQSFISTEAAVLMSLLSQKMPNLFDCIVQCANPASTETDDAESTGKQLTAGQIKEARAHPNGIVLHALNAVATIQSALNSANKKIGELEKQRDIIKQQLAEQISAQQEQQKKQEKEQ